MQKKLYWLVESNADLSVTCKELPTCTDLIKEDFEETEAEEKEQAEYTITPVWYTDEEYQELGEADN